MLIDFLQLDSLSQDQAQRRALFVGAAIIAHSVLAGNYYRTVRERASEYKMEAAIRMCYDYAGDRKVSDGLE